jgi:large subunit ribosomal protein L1
MTTGKRLVKSYEGIDRTAFYDAAAAVKLVKERAKAKFDETVEVSVNLNVDPRKSEQNVRGTVQLPNGTGKTLRRT